MVHYNTYYFTALSINAALSSFIRGVLYTGYMLIALIKIYSLTVGEAEYHTSLAIIHSCAVLGVFFGCEIAEKFGRIRCFIVSNGVYVMTVVICVVSCFISKSAESVVMVFGKILIGIIIGMNAYIVPLYSNLIFSPRNGTK